MSTRHRWDWPQRGFEATHAQSGERGWTVQPSKRHSPIAVADDTVLTATNDFSDSGVFLLPVSLLDGVSVRSGRGFDR